MLTENLFRTNKFNGCCSFSDRKDNLYEFVRAEKRTPCVNVIKYRVGVPYHAQPRAKNRSWFKLILTRLITRHSKRDVNVGESIKHFLLFRKKQCNCFQVFTRFCIIFRLVYKCSQKFYVHLLLPAQLSNLNFKLNLNFTQKLYANLIRFLN